MLPGGQRHDVAIALENVTKHFYKGHTRITAVSGITIGIRYGSFVSILGPSGCGKSTILNLIAGLEDASEGGVYYNGVPVRGICVGIGYLTQHDTLLPWRTVEDNVRLPLDFQSRRFFSGRNGPQDRDRVKWAIDLVGLAGFERHLPGELSGGMRKRAALAQQLVYARETILMDEPFGALDFQTRLQLHEELLRIWSAEKRTIVFVTHDLEEAITLSDEIVILSHRPGRIRDVVAVDLPRPRDPVAVRFEPRFRELYEKLWSEMKRAS
jgi:NitT/TauT family transport system ATP-binding protein